MSFLEPIGFFVQWDVTRSSIPKIKGYKVKLWSIEENTTRNYKLLNGDQYPGLERNDIAQEAFNESYTAKNEVTEITSINAYHNEARLLSIAKDTLYEIRVFTYKDEDVGPMSDPIRVKIMKSKTDYTVSEDIVKPRPVYTVLAERQFDYCKVSIITNTTDGDPFIHKTFI
ncbi:unnamed protein product [Leptosia nina]|uniref:Uncharacterized protein n=1 Tax=Leptosia nina TaxID=320188 RepID=A0AAV1J694_9NEOP